MSARHSCLIQSRHPGTPPTELVFVERPVGKAQKRFCARVMLMPELDLADYRFTGQIDWIEVLVETGRASQFHHVKSAVETVVTRSTYVEPVDPGAGGVTRSFKIRLQETSLAQVTKVAAVVSGRFDGCSCRIIGMELGIDIYPRVPSEAARLRMLGVVQRMIHPKMELFKLRLSQPRSVAPSISAHLFPDPQKRRRNITSVWNETGFCAPHTDATMYVGARDKDDAMIRIEEKVSDERNPERGTFRNLAEEEKRVRVEVRLKGDALAALGDLDVARLAVLKLTPLQGRYFTFAAPALHDPSASAQRPVTAYVNRQLAKVFLSSGVVALEAHNIEKGSLRKMHEVDRMLRLMGHKRRRPTEAVSFVAHEELNGRVEAALRHLQNRERHALAGVLAGASTT